MTFDNALSLDEAITVANQMTWNEPQNTRTLRVVNNKAGYLITAHGVFTKSTGTGSYQDTSFRCGLADGIEGPYEGSYESFAGLFVESAGVPLFYQTIANPWRVFRGKDPWVSCDPMSGDAAALGELATRVLNPAMYRRVLDERAASSALAKQAAEIVERIRA